MYDNKEYGLLALEPIVSKPNERDSRGHYVKGYTPHNKGKKMEEYCSEVVRQKILQNLTHTGGAKNRKLKKVIAISDDGKFVVFPSAREYAKRFGISPTLAYKTARLNSKDLCPNLKRNECVEYRAKGLRLYFEKSVLWLDKIKYDV